MAGVAGRLHRAGPVVARSQGERLSVLLPGLSSDLVARQRLPGSPPHRPCLGAPSVRQGKPCLQLLPFPLPFPGRLYSSCSVRFLEDTWETTVSCGICQPVSAVCLLAWLCSEAHFF